MYKLLIFIAKICSYLFHPVFIPIIGVALIMYLSILMPVLSNSFIITIFILTALFTIVLPLSTILFLYQNKFIKSPFLEARKDRILPYFIIFIYFYVFFLITKKISPDKFISIFIFSCSISILLLLLVTYLYKLSTHMLGIGGLTGLLLSLSNFYRIDLMLYIVIVIFISGIIGTSRLVLNKHSFPEVVIGYFIGLLSIYILNFMFF